MKKQRRRNKTKETGESFRLNIVASWGKNASSRRRNGTKPRTFQPHLPRGPVLELRSKVVEHGSLELDLEVVGKVVCKK